MLAKTKLAMLSNSLQFHQSLFTRATGPAYTNLPCTTYVTIAMMTTPMNITGAQLNDSASTGVAFGQNVQKLANVA